MTCVLALFLYIFASVYFKKVVRIASVLFVLTLALTCRAQNYAFGEVIAYPGAWRTTITSQQDGLIYGEYYVSGGTTYKTFIYDGSSYTNFSYPGSRDTQITGISGNTIVGSYRKDGQPRTQFVYDGTSYSNFIYPGGSASGISISGNKIYGKNNGIDFVYANGKFTDIIYPGSSSSYIQGVAGNLVIGQYVWFDSTADRGFGAYVQSPFLFDGDTYSPLNHILDPNANWLTGYPGVIYNYTHINTVNYPGATSTTINGFSGDNVVGIYSINEIDPLWGGVISVSRSFIYDGNNYATINYPGATSTGLIGIEGNLVIGRSSMGDFTLTIPEPSSYGLMGLCVLGLAILRRKSNRRGST